MWTPSSKPPSGVLVRLMASSISLVSALSLSLIHIYEHMTEAEAHRYIEKQAMDTRRDRTEIAQEFLENYEDMGV